MLETLQKRFEQNENRHPGVSWATVEALLRQKEALLRAASAVRWSRSEEEEGV